MKHGITSAIGEGSRYNSSKYAIGLIRRLFWPVGVWPLSKNATGFETNGRRLRLILSVTLISSYLIPQYLYLLRSSDSSEIVEMLAPLIFDMLAMIKFVIYVLKAKHFGYCVNFLKDDWNAVKLENDRDTMMTNARFGRLVGICCFCCTYSGVFCQNISWPIMKFISDLKEENSNATGRVLPYPITYVYFDEMSTPIYEITLVVQFIGSTYVCILNYGGYGFVGALVSHACGQLQIIGSKLEDLVDGNRGESHTTKLRMGAIVDHHSKIIQYVVYLRESLHIFFLTEEVGAVVIICLTGYRTIPYWNKYHSVLGMSIYLYIEVAVIISLLVISTVGQRLMDESQKVEIAVSRVQWYRLPPEISKGLIVCMARAGQPLKLTACDMFDVSLANFGDVLRSAYVFLNLVRKVTDFE